MQSEKARELAARQKAERAAEKARKKNSTDPRDWGRFRQIIEAYRQTAKVDPKLNLFSIGALVGLTALFTLIGVFLQPWWIWTLLGLMGGLVAVLYILTWRAKRASYTRYEGQVGSAEVAFGDLNAKKFTRELGIAATRQMDVVHRVIGEQGIILVGEGNAGRVRQLLTNEAKKHEQVAYGVKVTSVIVGREKGQVPLDQLAKHIQKLPKVVQPHQITDIKARLRALDAVRPKMPIPRGPMPTMKGVNRAMRGR